VGFAVAVPEATLWLPARPDQRGELCEASEPGGIRAHGALIKRYKRMVTDGQQQQLVVAFCEGFWLCLCLVVTTCTSAWLEVRQQQCWQEVWKGTVYSAPLYTHLERQTYTRAYDRGGCVVESLSQRCLAAMGRGTYR
jgi:hypothetical protein